jgi:hypothetical protein
MSLAGDIAFLLRNAGFVHVIEGQLPAKPDEVVMVRALGGLDPLRTHGTEVYAQPRAQVLVRANTYAIASEWVEQAWRLLFKSNIIINGTRYLSIQPIDSPADLGADQQQPPRRMFSFNVQIMKEA